MFKNQKTLRFLFEVCKKTHLIILCIVAVLLSLCALSYVTLFRNMIDSATANELNPLTTSVQLLILVTVSQITLLAIQRFFVEYSKSSLENRLKSRLFQTLLHSEYGSFSNTHSGEWLNRLTSDTIVVADGLTTILPEFMGMLTKLFGALLFLLVLIPDFAYVLLICGIIFISFSYFFRKSLKTLHKTVQESDGAVRIFLQECLSNSIIIRTFAKEHEMVSQAEDKMKHHQNMRLKRSHFSNACNVGFSIAMRGVYISSAIYCAYQIFNNAISYGTFVAVLQLVTQIQSPVANISGYFPKFYAMLSSAERLMEAESFESEHTAEVLSPAQVQTFYNDSFYGLGFDNATFTYPSKTPVPTTMQNFNLHIKKGEYVAFTGASGIGKSTSLKLLMSLYSLDSGVKYIVTPDGKIPLTYHHRCLFAYVPQGNHLMSGTIRQVVCFYDKEKMQDEARIYKALDIACALDFVKEKGLDTHLGEKGFGLSEGQMQRLAIARAILSDRPILMLDECTSALDEATERTLIQNLKTMTNKTVLIITHRNSILDICNHEVKL